MSAFPPDFKPAWEDRVVDMRLLSPSDTDFTYERPDKTRYVLEIRKNKEDNYYTPEFQMELISTKPEPFNYDKEVVFGREQPPMDFNDPWPHGGIKKS